MNTLNSSGNLSGHWNLIALNKECVWSKKNKELALTGHQTKELDYSVV